MKAELVMPALGGANLRYWLICKGLAKSGHLPSQVFLCKINIGTKKGGDGCNDLG